MVQELERGREERRKDPTSPQDPLDDSFDAYMKAMKTLQFGEFMPTELPGEERGVWWPSPGEERGVW